MPSYTLELELFSSYVTDIPGFEIWADGVQLGATYSVTSGGYSISVSPSYGGALPTSLEFRFSDVSVEVPREIEIRSVKINDQYVNTGNYLSSKSLVNGGNSTVDIANSPYFYDSSDPALSEFTTGATQTFTAGNDTLRAYNGTSDEVFDALAGRDVFYLGSGNDKVFGNAGDDIIYAGAGNDLISGGDDNDRIYGGDGDDRLYGGNGNDRIHGEGGNDEIHGGDGDDRLNGHTGDDVITGGIGADKLNGGSGADYLFGGGDNDQLVGASGNDTLDGGAGEDLIYGGADDDIINGGDDNDVLIGNIGVDEIHGDDGDDTIYIMTNDWSAGEAIYGGAGTDELILSHASTVDFTTGTLETLETLTGSDGNQDVTYTIEQALQFTTIDLAGGVDNSNVQIADTIDVTSLATPVVTNVENGFLLGSAGVDDVTISGAQLDALVFGGGTIDFDAGTDVLNLTSTSANLNTLGSTLNTSVLGLETISASTAAAAVTINLSAQTENFTLTGSDFSDFITSGAGNDVIDGGFFGDTIDGGAGDDIINGGNGLDFLFGGIGNDTLNGDEGADTIYGNEGDDTLDGGDNDDILIGGTGLAPVIDATTLLSYAGAQDGATTITYFNGGVTLDGNPWKKILIDYTVTANTIIEFDFRSTLEGDIHGIGFDNDDNIDNDTNKFKVYGTQDWNRDHDDFNNYDGSGNWEHYKIDVGSFFTGTFSHLTIIGDDDSNPRGNGHWANFIIYENIVGTEADTITGGTGNDQLLGMTGDDTLNGDDGDDVVSGNDGNDNISGGIGNDTLHGGNDNDILDGGGNNDELYGGAGNDILLGGTGNDFFDGGAGTDTASFAGYTTYVNVDLSNTAAQNTREGTDTFINIENLIGTDFNDTLQGDSNTNQIDGGLGADNIWGNGGADVLNGEDGDDNFFVQGTDAFDDTFNGGAGFDEISLGGDSYFNGSSTFNSIEQLDMNGNRALAELNGGFDFTGMTVTARGNMEGQGGNETITGSDSNDLIYGFAGNDTLSGGIGSDQIWGGDDADTINGGDDDDTIRGEAGADILNGDNGNDDFFISGNEGLGDTFNGGADYDELQLEGNAFLDLTATFTNMERIDFNTFTITAVLNDGFDLSGMVRTGGGDLLGQGGNETMTGTESADTISGLAGDDIINGSGGGDILNGDAGNDTLNGGIGSDDLFGGDDIDTINGGDDDDDIYGEAGADILNGDEGNDNFYIVGIEGVGDVVDGGNGSDDLILTGAAFLGGGSFTNMEVLRFNGFDITATLNGTFDVSGMVRNGAGELLGQGGNENITGTASNDTIRGLAGNDILSGADGGDIIYGGDNDDTLNGDAGNDDLYGEAGADTINGGDGVDDIYGGAGGDTLNGDAGNDNFWLSGTEGIGDQYNGGDDYDRLYLETNVTLGGGVTFTNMEELRFQGFNITAVLNESYDLSSMVRSGVGDLLGQGGNETITGTQSNDTIYGYAGSDTLNGHDGGDTIYGGDDADTINGGEGADLIYGEAGADNLNGDAGNDDFFIGGTEGLGDQFNGGDDTDDLVLTSEATLNLATTFANMELVRFNGFNIIADLNSGFNLSGMTRTGLGDLLGQAGDESITGTEGTDNIYGFDGNDTLNGGGGGDYLYGGAGADIINGGDGNDNIYITGTDALGDQYDGGTGTDYLRMDADVTFNMANTFTNLTAIISGGFNILSEVNGGFDLTGQTISGGRFLYGNTGNETITGSESADNIYGGDGNDTINGGEGNDDIYGGAGSDILNGGEGTNEYFIGAGSENLGDVYIGGTGADYIYMSEATDFNSANSFTDIDRLYTGGFNINLVAGTTISFLGIQMVGASNIYGTASTETITGSISADSFYGGAGADVIIGGDGNDDFYVGGTDALGVTFDGGNDSDDIQLLSDASFNTTSTFTNFERIVTNGFNINIVSGSTVSFAGITASGVVNIYGAAGTETITGTESGDNIYAGDGADIINGGAGNDNFWVSGTESLGDVYDGGAGTDYVRLSADSQFNSANSFTNLTSIVTNGFNMYVTSGSTVDFSSMTRNGAGETYGAAGNETIIGFSNTNVLHGLGGADTMTGGTGNDSFWVSGTESLGDVYNGNGGTDYVRLGADSYFDNTTVFNGIYGVVFNGFNMIVTSGSTVDLSGMIRSGTGQIHGEGGNETIIGMDSGDTIFGFGGNDVLTGGLGNDTIDGGTGINVAVYDGDALEFSVDVVGGTIRVVDDRAALNGDEGSDVLSNISTLRFNGVDYDISSYDTSGNGSAQTIIGTNGGNTISAGNNTDIVFGGRGNDNLSGDNGDDTIFGGAGDDIIYGNNGLDSLYGGIGADTFVFENANAFNNIDGIYDFDTLETDAIDITDLLTGYTFGVDDLTDFVQILDNGANSDAYVDVTGTGTFGAGTQIATLYNVTGLTDEIALETLGNLITH